MNRKKDDSYYRNNTVNLNPREVKDKPGKTDGAHQPDGDQMHHSDTPKVIDQRRKAHKSPTIPNIIESETEVQYETSLYDTPRDQNTNNNHTGSRHLYSERDKGQGLYSELTLPKFEDEESFVKRGCLSSPPLSPGQRDLVYLSSKDNPEPITEPGHPLTNTKVLPDESDGSQKVVYLIRSPRKSVQSTESTISIGNSLKHSTMEDELKSLSTTPRYSHEDLGRIVSPPSPETDSEYSKTDQNMVSNMNDDVKSLLMDVDGIKRDLQDQENKRIKLQTELEELQESVQDLYSKLAVLRIKLGVANANTNVGKTECEKLRKKFQETQIQLARLEERSKSCTTELERLKDPNNPDSNVNMKKIVVNDRKEIRRLRNELEGIRSERSEARNQMEEQDDRIATLKRMINSVDNQLKEGTEDYEEAKVRCDLEEKEREEIEVQCNELLKERDEFEAQFAKLNNQLESKISDTSTIHKLSEQYKIRENSLMSKIATADKKLRDVLTEIEQKRNQDMPQRTASSIKYHQYRMSKTSGIITDTTPQVVLTSDPKGSIAASGNTGKNVVSQKPATSLPSKNPGTRQTNKGKSGSLPSKR